MSASAPVLPMPGRILGVNPVDHPGGAEVVALRLLAGLAGRGWEVALSTPDGGALADAARAAGMRWHPLPVGGLERGAGRRALASWPALRRLTADVDVVLLNGAVCGRLLPALRGLGTVTVLDVNDMVDRVPRFWGWADLLLADSEAVAARLRDLDPRLLPLVVGVPVELDPPVVEAPWPSGGGPVVGYVGRLEPRKGVEDLLAAVPALRAAQPDLRVVLVGDAPWGDRAHRAAVLERAAALGVEHVGFRPDATSLMRHLDVLVLPSHAEPFGTVLAEAMAVGTPVVATAVDGLVEVVEDGVSGRLVPPGSPEALARGVLEVLERRAEMSTAARARAARWEAGAFAARIDGLLRGLLARRGPRR